MKHKHHRRAACRPKLSIDETLQQSMHRVSARDTTFIGFYLARLRQARGQTVAEQAADMNLSASALAFLALCKTPRAEQRAEDLAAVAQRVGVDAAALDALLREADRLLLDPPAETPSA